MRASILVLGRCWRASARPRCRCPAAARSVRVRWTSTSRACRPWAPRSPSRHGYIHAKAKRLKGARIVTDMITVTGTENLLMAAAWPKARPCWKTPREPEVTDLANLLVKMGAKIDGIGTDRLVIQGVEKLHGAEHA
jgi:UDP-N-acetylglucosamine 1-carboxyvinyltransferase